MLKKILTLNNLASFKNYSWNSAMANAANDPDFADINIIFGQNGTGKTSLSRILRSWETKEPMPYLEGAAYSFEEEKNGVTAQITQNNYKNCNGTYRVFNADFVSENLTFISGNSDSEKIGARSFAIIGKENIKNGIRIKEIAAELRDEAGNGLLADKNAIEIELKRAGEECDKCDKLISNILSVLATDRNQGIKYDKIIRPDKNGENYDVRSLRKDMEEMSKCAFSPIDPDENTLLYEELKTPEMAKIDAPYIDIEPLTLLWESVNEILSREVLKVGKIRELVENHLLGNWVKEGMHLHETDHSTCRFCGHKISEERWEMLQLHFNDELERLLKAIAQELQNVEDEYERYNKFSRIDESNIYPQFRQKWEEIAKEHDFYLKYWEEQIETMREALLNKQVNVYLTQKIEWDVEEAEKEFSLHNAFVHDFVDEINNYTAGISVHKEKIRTKLRYNRISNYLNAAHYYESVSERERINSNYEELYNKNISLAEKIAAAQTEINRLKQGMLSEKEGAEKVNDYLTRFGQKVLRLEPVLVEGEEACTRFEILRNGITAYHLSEGESRLIAFCYFMARLDGIGDFEDNPIIWIDDPICSLDSSHIYNIYAVIRANIIDKRKFNQLFISTHSLEFLRYLVKIQGVKLDRIPNVQKEKVYEKRYYIIEKDNDSSRLKLMPKYLHMMVTQFNYLFEKIYKLAIGPALPDDLDLDVYVAMQNNMRKFIELYTSFHFPDGRAKIEDVTEKLNIVLGPGNTEKTYSIMRICNEGSHLANRYDEALDPILPVELKTAAQDIIRAIEQYDKAQFDALVEAVNL